MQSPDSLLEYERWRFIARQFAACIASGFESLCELRIVNMKGTMNSARLQKHVYSTYTRLRYGLAFIAAVFPVLLYAGGQFIYGIPPLDTMSEYYFATPAPGGDAPMRAWFIGLLFAIGVFLILYRGFSMRENLMLNLAGVLAICVAIFPMPWGCGQACPVLNVHRMSAILFFACIAYVSIRCSRETLYLIEDEKLRSSYRRKYRFIGVAMLSSPILALALSTLSGHLRQYVSVFETVGVWAFAYYWWTKSRELAGSGAELLAVQGKLGS
jgi:hypothetical protein